MIDPNRFRFRTVLRTLGLVLLFLQKVNRKCNKSFDILKKHDFNQVSSEMGSYIVSPVTDFVHTSKSTKVAVVYLSEEMLDAAKAYFS